MHLNIDCLAFIVALRASLDDPATGNLMNKIYLAIEAAPGFRPLTRAELVEETGRAYALLTEQNSGNANDQLKPEWAALAGSL